MNVASIDIGSNTVLLLIASIENNTLFPILNRYESPRLGKGLKIGGIILNERIDHLLKILSEYKDLINLYKCEHTIITATNAMRIASNSGEIIDKVKYELGMNIKIVDGDEEARLSFIGASSTINNDDNRVVIDIGGGSTEVIYGNNEKIIFKKSFQTGVVSLTEKYLEQFPYPVESLNNAKEHLNNIFREIKSIIPPNLPTIAVAGTPTTLSCIKQGLKLYDEKKVEGSILNINDINKLHDTLKYLSGNEILNKFGEVVSGREDVLFSGLLILETISTLILLDIIIVSSRGIRYGNIYNYILSLK